MNTINNIFDQIPIFWINLDASVGRCLEMRKQLNGFNINKRIQAIDGRNQEQFNKNYKIINYTSIFSTSIIAVICSHIKAIKTGYDLNYDIICVLEDDAKFDLIKYYPFTLKDIIKRTDKDWDAIQLYVGDTDKLKSYLDSSLKGKKLKITKRIGFHSGTAYIINRKGMEKILNSLDTDGEKYFDFKNIKIPSVECYIFKNLNSYILNFPFIYYFSNSSTIDIYLKKKNNFSEKCKKSSFDIQKKSMKLLKKFYINNFIKPINVLQ